MIYCPYGWLLWKQISMYSYNNINILRNLLKELNYIATTSPNMFGNNIACLAIAWGCHTWMHSSATAKQAIFLQNILWESCSKFDFKQRSFIKSLKILVFQQKYMERCFHGSQLSWGMNHSFVNLYSNYQPPSFICFSILLAPVISSLDKIYCTDHLVQKDGRQKQKYFYQRMSK